MFEDRCNYAIISVKLIRARHLHPVTHPMQMLQSYIAESYLTLYLTVLEHAAIAEASRPSHAETSPEIPSPYPNLVRSADPQTDVVRSADPNFTRGHISDNVIATATASPPRPLAVSPLEKLLQERSKIIEKGETSALVRGVKLALAFALEALTHIGNW